MVYEISTKQSNPFEVCVNLELNAAIPALQLRPCSLSPWRKLACMQQDTDACGVVSCILKKKVQCNRCGGIGGPGVAFGNTATTYKVSYTHAIISSTLSVGWTDL